MARARRRPLEDVLLENGVEFPTVHPRNRKAWNAFRRVSSYRHAPMGHPWRPDWADISAVLSLWGLWERTIQAKLEVLFAVLITLEAEEREAEQNGRPDSGRN